MNPPDRRLHGRPGPIRWRDRHDPHAAPRRHPKGAFILDGGADRTDWSDVGAAVRGLADPRPPVGSGDRLDLRRRRLAVVRPGGLPVATISGTTWTHSSEGLTYGDDGAEDPDGLERHAGPRLDLRRRRAGRPVPERRRRQDLVARLGPARPPEPPGPGWSPGAGGLISTRSSPTRPTPTGCGSRSARSGRSRPRTAGRPGRRATAGVRRTATRRTRTRRPGSASTSS